MYDKINIDDFLFSEEGFTITDPTTEEVRPVATPSDAISPDVINQINDNLSVIVFILLLFLVLQKKWHNIKARRLLLLTYIWINTR